MLCSHYTVATHIGYVTFHFKDWRGAALLQNHRSYVWTEALSSVVFVPAQKSVMPSLPLLAGDLRFFASSPPLPLWYVSLPLFTALEGVYMRKFAPARVSYQDDFLLGCPSGKAQSKNGGRLFCAEKRQNGGQIRFPVPPLLRCC